MNRLIGLWRLFRHDLVTLIFAAINPKTPGKIRTGLLLAVLYLISPIDLIPDAVPVVGLLDDAVLLPAAIAILTNMLPQSVKYESEYKASRYGRYMPIVAGVAGILVLAWTFLVFYGIYSLLFK